MSKENATELADRIKNILLSEESNESLKFKLLYVLAYNGYCKIFNTIEEQNYIVKPLSKKYNIYINKAFYIVDTLAKTEREDLLNTILLFVS